MLFFSDRMLFASALFFAGSETVRCEVFLLKGHMFCIFWIINVKCGIYEDSSLAVESLLLEARDERVTLAQSCSLCCGICLHPA